jgi:hypothetical protein
LDSLQLDLITKQKIRRSLFSTVFELDYTYESDTYVFKTSKFKSVLKSKIIDFYLHKENYGNLSIWKKKYSLGEIGINLESSAPFDITIQENDSFGVNFYLDFNLDYVD